MFVYRNGQITQAVRDQSASFSGNAFTFEPPSINDLGDIAFTADLGVFMKSGSTITKIAGIGDPSPDGGVYSFFSGPLINHNRQVVFVGLTSVGSGIFASTNGGPAFKIAAAGDTSPFGGQFFFFNFLPAPLAQNDAGQVAFSAFVGGPSGSSSVTNGTLTLPIVNNTAIGGGKTLFNTNLVSMNNAGDIAFDGGISGESSNQVLIFSGGTITELTHGGQSAPSGGTFTGGTAPWINTARQVAFLGHLEENSGGVFVAAANTQIARVAEAGDPVTGTPSFVSVQPLAGFNRLGTAGIFGLTFPGGNGLFLGKASGTSLITHIGDPLPGGGVAANLNFGSLNNNDQMAILAGGSTITSQIVVGSASGLTHIATTGDTSPDGGTFFAFGEPSINNMGQVAFPGFTSGTSQSGAFLAANGQITELFNQNDPAPGGGTLGSPAALSLNDRGQVAFTSQPPTGQTLFLFSQGSFTLIAANGQPAPGGGTFNLLSGSNGGPFINRRGDVVFSSFATSGTAVYLFSQGHVSRVAGPGDAMPGGGTLTAASQPTINDAGQVAFAGQFVADFAVFLRVGATTARVAGKGDTAPGGGKLTTASAPKINAQGQIAFSGGLTTGDSVLEVATPNATK